MRKSNLHNYFVDITAALLILLFIYTGISKLNDRQLFQAILSKLQLIGPYSTPLSLALPIIELVTSVLLLFPATKTIGLWASLVLMLLFTGYIGYMLLSHSRLPCSCGGVLRQLTWIQHLEFNILFTLLPGISLWFIYHNKRFVATNRESRTPV